MNTYIYLLRKVYIIYLLREVTIEIYLLHEVTIEIYLLREVTPEMCEALRWKTDCVA